MKGAGNAWRTSKKTVIMRSFLFIVVLLSAVVLVLPVHADKTDIFVSKCGQCHHKDGQAKPVNPADKAGIVWVKYFKRQRHPVNLDQQVTESEMLDILAYLKKHAADSEQPFAAAIPQ